MRTWTKDEIIGLRKALRLSQTSFGDLIGVTRQYVYYLERGVRTPSKTLAILLECINQKETKKKKEVKEHGKKNARTV